MFSIVSKIAAADGVHVNGLHFCALPLRYQLCLDTVSKGRQGGRKEVQKSRDKRRYPISEEQFNQEVLPIILDSYRGKGRPQKVSHYQAFCGIVYILRTGCPLRGVPAEYGYWHVVYGRFNRGSERELWAKILLELP